jgi:hypothetical protein
MDILEIEQKETMSREEAATRLRAFADTLARHNDIEFERWDAHEGSRARRDPGQGRAGDRVR